MLLRKLLNIKELGKTNIKQKENKQLLIPIFYIYYFIYYTKDEEPMVSRYNILLNLNFNHFEDSGIYNSANLAKWTCTFGVPGIS